MVCVLSGISRYIVCTVDAISFVIYHPPYIIMYVIFLLRLARVESSRLSGMLTVLYHSYKYEILLLEDVFRIARR